MNPRRNTIVSPVFMNCRLLRLPQRYLLWRSEIREAVHRTLGVQAKASRCLGFTPAPTIGTFLGVLRRNATPSAALSLIASFHKLVNCRHQHVTSERASIRVSMRKNFQTSTVHRLCYGSQSDPRKHTCCDFLVTTQKKIGGGVVLAW